MEIYDILDEFNIIWYAPCSYYLEMWIVIKLSSKFSLILNYFHLKSSKLVSSIQALAPIELIC